MSSIRLEVEVPQLPVSKQDAFLAVIDHCTVHNSTRTPPGVSIELAVPRLAA